MVFNRGVTIHVFVLNSFGTGCRFGTGLCTAEFPEQKSHVFIFRLQLHMWTIYVMANASENTCGNTSASWSNIATDILQGLNTTIPHRDVGGCDLQTTVRRALQSTQ